MPYNSETETFYQAPATVVDSTPDGDTVQEGFDDRLTPALAGVYADFNLLKADGMISVGIPATTTARGIGRVATTADAAVGSTITNGPAFLDAATWKVSATPAAGVIPLADVDGSVNNFSGARYATCATAAATAAKDAALTGFSLVKGSRVFVTFANTNTVAGPLTLNVNGTGAKAIYNEFGAVSATNPATFPAGVPIEFVYDDNGHWAYRKYQDEFAKAVGGAPMFTARAWVNFDGTTTVPTIRSSGNVASVTKSSTGFYTINFIVHMPNANFAYTISGVKVDCGGYYNEFYCTSVSTGSISIEIHNNAAATGYNNPNISVTVFA